MLLEIGLKNFKAFGNDMQSTPLTKLNFIYGPNSGGKSSLIQALLLLKQSHRDSNDTMYFLREPKGKLLPRGDFVDLGSLSAVAYKHEIDNNIEIKLAYDGFVYSDKGYDHVQNIMAMMTFAPDRPYDATDFVGLEYMISHEKATILNSTWTCHATNPTHSSITKTFVLGDVHIPPDMVEVSKSDFLPYLYVPGLMPEIGVNWAETSVRPNVQELKTRLEAHLSPEQFKIARAMPGSESYNSVLDYVTYLGPLRSYPARMYTVFGQNRETTGVRGEFTPDLLYANPTLVDRANYWFKRLGIPYDLSANTFGDPKSTGEYVSLELVDQHTNTSVTLADVGFGINQLLPVIIEGLLFPSDRSILQPGNPIICIEQPEIHLHPRLQAEIADLMVETSSGRFGKQWLVETHSEMLIRRIQRRIEEGVISPDDVTVLYVDPRGSSGSEIRNLRLNDDGDFIDRWPRGFFEEAYNEIMGRGR